MRFDHLEPEVRRRLEERYGLNQKRRWPVIATISLAFGIPWLVWSGWHHANPPFRSELVKYRVTNDRGVEVTFTVSRRDPSRTLTCTLIARDFQKNVVGEIDYPIAASESKIISLTTEIPTRIEAVSAEISGCAIK